jgi:hypothetical protein
MEKGAEKARKECRDHNGAGKKCIGLNYFTSSYKEV